MSSDSSSMYASEPLTKSSLRNDSGRKSGGKDQDLRGANLYMMMVNYQSALQWAAGRVMTIQGELSVFHERLSRKIRDASTFTGTCEQTPFQRDLLRLADAAVSGVQQPKKVDTVEGCPIYEFKRGVKPQLSSRGRRHARPRPYGTAGRVGTAPTPRETVQQSSGKIPDPTAGDFAPRQMPRAEASGDSVTLPIPPLVREGGGTATVTSLVPSGL